MTKDVRDVVSDLIDVPKGPGCEHCSHTGQMVWFFPRGPNIPPGNQVLPCIFCYQEVD